MPHAGFISCPEPNVFEGCADLLFHRLMTLGPAMHDIRCRERGNRHLCCNGQRFAIVRDQRAFSESGERQRGSFTVIQANREQEELFELQIGFEFEHPKHSTLDKAVETNWLPLLFTILMFGSNELTFAQHVVGDTRFSVETLDQRREIRACIEIDDRATVEEQEASVPQPSEPSIDFSRRARDRDRRSTLRARHHREVFPLRKRLRRSVWYQLDRS